MMFRHCRPRTVHAVAFALFGSVGVATPIYAQIDNGQDTRLRLDQQLDRQRARQEEKGLEEADGPIVPDSLVIDGRTYSVGNNVNEMGKALYIAVGRRQWADARRFLRTYEELPDHDPMLVLYAKGGLARARGDLAEAEGQYRALLKFNPTFLPGQLELARVLFETRKDREAKQAFQTIRAQLVDSGQNAQGVLRTVIAFLGALKKRQAWQGSLSLGPIYSDNVNQSSASYTCLLANNDGACLVERKVPDAIKATGISFEGGINRRIAIGGHSGVRGRAIFFGEVYPNHNDFSQATIITRLGYDYQTARDGVAISPSFDLGTLGSSVLYRAWGINAEWTHIFSTKVIARLEANHRDFDYLLPGYQSQDGPLTDVSLTTWYVPSRNWTIFAGLDFATKDTPLAIDAYNQWGGRLGVHKAFGQSASLLVIGSYRRREFRAYSELFEAQRGDDQFNATAIARFPALKFLGLIPEAVVQHTRVESNIDWLYSYKRTTASLRLSYAF